MRQLLRGTLYLTSLLVLGLFAEFGVHSKMKVSSAQSDFDSCLIEIDRCYQEITTRHMNLKLAGNVEWLYNQALEDFRNQKSNNVNTCNQYAERMCHMWQQSKNNRYYTGQDMRNYEYYQSRGKETQTTKPESTNNRGSSGRYQREYEDYPVYEEEQFEEDSCVHEEDCWEYEDCIWEGESEEYCQEFL